MSEIVIREMLEHHIPEVLAIERVSFSMPWTERAFYQELHKTYALSRVAVLRERVIGYMCVNLIFDECHILNLAVQPDFRRQGVATNMMNHVLRESKEKGCKFFYLEVRVSNTGAKAFYQRFGFEVAGTRRNYYVSPAEDAVVMVLRNY